MSKSLTVQQIHLDLELDEAERLEKHCNQTRKTETDVIHELIRKLPDYPDCLPTGLEKQYSG
ncbi:hypothetical protein NIES4103_25230 [Nostoc sp. NIES-4103]|nr:hypothetical protein NIES4103_25230 [Nostoc sp. NIES-4103]